jgi:segregation and condensation protein B
MNKLFMKGLLESLLLVSTRPLTLDTLVRILDDCQRSDIRETLNAIKEETISRERGFYLEEVGEGFQFRTRGEYAPWIRKLEGIRPVRLSKAALETLAIIAYKQPVIRADIEGIRGVDVGSVLKTLLDKRLIKILGRKEIPGRPIAYGTAKEFLELFSLKDLSSLPTLKEMEREGLA